MMILGLLLVLPIVMIPSDAFAWGPLTHIYLGSQALTLGSFLPAGIYALIRKYKHDFIYGNIMADSILAKKYLPRDKNTHNWEVGLGILDSAGTDSERAFSLGYLSHLAADTVAHGELTSSRKNIGHTIVEMKADSLVDRSYWGTLFKIDRKVQKRNDMFLSKSVDSVMFSFGTNKRIFKGMVALAYLNKKNLHMIFGSKHRHHVPENEIVALKSESLVRVIDVLENGKDSKVLLEDPMAKFKKSKDGVFEGILI